MAEIGDVDTMKNYIERVCEDEAECMQLSAASIEQASKFSWHECAKQTFDAYLFALNGK